MNKEQLIEKGVKHAFNGKKTLFSVDSLEKHFDGLEIHESDILTDEFEDQDEGYVKVSDVNFDSATANEVAPEEEVEETVEDSGNTDGMSFEEAEVILNEGNLVALPEWEGFWFKNLHEDKLLVFTKDGEILDTPLDEYKERTDWKKVEATEDQFKALAKYFDDLEIAKIKVEDPIIETGKKVEDVKSDSLNITEEVKKEETKTEEAKPSARKDFEAKNKGRK